MSFLGKLFGAKRENEPARPPAEAPRPEPCQYGNHSL